MNAILTLDLPGSIVPKTARKASRKIADKADVLVFKPVLSEEEILAMAAKDYMNDAQLAFFKSRLQQMEQDLLQSIEAQQRHELKQKLAGH